MKVIFAADMSFNYLEGFPGKDKAHDSLKGAAEIFKKADFKVVNLENVFGNREDGNPIVKSGPNLISDDNFIEYIHALKPDVVGLANNHTKDFDEDIMFHTIDMLKKSDYQVMGAGKNLDDAYAPAVVSKDGIEVAVIAVCENEFGAAKINESGTAGYKLGYVTREILKALKDGKKPVVYFHGGNETNPIPSPMKVELYRHFIDIGAEAVIAMHTHCPQGYEMYNGKPIVYSMGNFFFPANRSALKSWNYGYMAMVDFTKDGTSLEIFPYRFDYEGHYILEGEEKEHFLKYIEVLNKTFEDEEELQKWFDAWCTTQLHYANALTSYKEEILTSNVQSENTRAKNVFNCEAHNEVVRNILNMAYECRFEEAKERVPLIKKLQEIEF